MPAGPELSDDAGAGEQTLTGSVACPKLQQPQRRQRSLLATLRLAAYDLALLVAGLLLLARVNQLPLPAHRVVWPVFAAGFLVAEVFVVYLHFRREAQRFGLSELPLVIGLFYAAPVGLVVAQLVGGCIALVTHGQRGLKLVFNVVHWMVATSLALLTFHAVTAGHQDSEAMQMLGAGVAVLLAAVLDHVSTTVAIVVSGGRCDPVRVVRMTAFGVAQSMANTATALVAVLLLEHDPASVLLLLVPLGGIFAAYRLYTVERQRHDRLLFLYETNRIWQAATDLDSAVLTLLRRASDMFRAERAEIILYPQGEHDTTRRAAIGPGGRVEPLRTIDPGEVHRLSTSVCDRGEPLRLTRRSGGDERAAADALGYDDVIAAPLLAETGALGSILVANRRPGVGAFDTADVKVFGTFADHAAIALENTRLDRQLKHQAFHDSLTHLANRALFSDRVEHALRRRPRDDNRVAVLFLDLDEFKVVNDTLGHATGDELLAAVARRVRGCIREFDTAARLGGDEFAVLLEDITSDSDATLVAQRIVDAFAEPFFVQGNRLAVGTSIGVVVSPTGSSSADELLAQADVAMYRSKENGRGSYSLFERSMQVAVLERHELRSDLERAIERNELRLHYQPIIDLAGQRVWGVEALIRWQHTDRGFMPPMSFIPLAEETGLIVGIGAWVLRESCRQVREWQRSLPECANLTANVNVSSRQLQSPTLLDDVQQALHASGLAATSLVVEITESVLLQDIESAVGTLERLRALGVRVAIDDFGTGYSSLGYLRRLPIDQVKVDRSFVSGVADGRDDRSLTLAIVRLLETLDVETVAEGIETREQLAYIASMGFDHGQGYLFSKPMAPLQLEPMLRRGAHVASAVA